MKPAQYKHNLILLHIHVISEGEKTVFGWPKFKKFFGRH